MQDRYTSVDYKNIGYYIRVKVTDPYDSISGAILGVDDPLLMLLYVAAVK